MIIYTEALNNNGRILNRDQINLSLPYRSYISNVLVNWTGFSKAISYSHQKKPIVVHLNVFYFIMVYI